MNISPIEEYSLRCLIQLARNQGSGPVTISKISGSEGLSTAYVGKLLYLLQKGGLIQSTRGVQGGYTLVKAPSKISLGEIFRALNTQSLEEVCNKYTGDQKECVHAGNCEIKSVWGQLARHIYSFLDKIYLADLAKAGTVYSVSGEFSLDQGVEV